MPSSRAAIDLVEFLRCAECVAQLLLRGAQAPIGQRRQGCWVGFPIGECLQHTSCTGAQQIRQPKWTVKTLTCRSTVKTQVRIAISVYVLVAIVRKRLALEANLYLRDARERTARASSRFVLAFA